MKRVTILGSTGSIGGHALEVIASLGTEFCVTGLSAHTDAARLVEQARRFNPRMVCIADPDLEPQVTEALSGTGVMVLAGRSGLLELSASTDADVLLNGLVGSAGLEPTLAALGAGIPVALSNKESLVMAGSLIEETRRQTGADLYPVDSEHSALWQCLRGEDPGDLRRIILTGSGGPFRTRDKDSFDSITVAEALRHPNWQMGRKITIDSATLMNKGLEVIEAYWLFRLDPGRIDVVIHPQSIVHSLVEFRDGSLKAQLGLPDMRLPIQYALTYPRHYPSTWERLDLVRCRHLDFEAPDLEKFPCLGLAYEALRRGGSAPAALNIANEEAVRCFLQEQIRFTQIPELIATALARHTWLARPTLEDLQHLETGIRALVRKQSGVE